MAGLDRQNQIRASRAMYRFTDRGSRPRSQRKVFRLPVRPLGNFFCMSVARGSEREFNGFGRTALRSKRSCVPKHRIHMHLSTVPTALDAGRQYRDRHARCLSACGRFLIATGKRLCMTPDRQPAHIAFEHAQMGEHAILRRQLPRSLRGQGIRV